MNEIKKEKEKLKALFKGKISKRVSIKEAKSRLKQTDPGIDISEILKAVDKKDDVFKIIIVEIISNPDFFVYYAPVLKEIIKLIIK